MMLYIGLVIMLGNAIWDLISPASCCCELNGCELSAKHD